MEGFTTLLLNVFAFEDEEAAEAGLQTILGVVTASLEEALGPGGDVATPAAGIDQWS